jgi:hypothetical protein
MTEAEWLANDDLEMMMRRLSSRQKRLFCVAFSRHYAMPEQYPSHADILLIAEGWADGDATAQDLEKILAKDEFRELILLDYSDANPPVISFLANSNTKRARRELPLPVAERRRQAELDDLIDAFPIFDMFEYEAAECESRAIQVMILRHIIGNPFQIHPPFSHFSSSVRDLAQAVYQQNATAIGPLNDALLDAGLTDLAAHFQDAAEWHPKGCWAIDLLTGRK